MRSSFAKQASSTPLNSLDLRCAKASIAVNQAEKTSPIESSGDELSLVLEAIGAAGMSDKEFAMEAGLDPAQWSRIKGGVGNLHAKVLFRQPAKFWVALNAVQQRRLGISQDTEDGLRRQHAKATADELWNHLMDAFARARAVTETAE